MCHLLLDFKFSQVILPRILGKTLLDPPQTGGLSPAQYNYTTRTPEDMYVGLHLVSYGLNCGHKGPEYIYVLGFG